MSKYLVEDTNLISVADAIREKVGITRVLTFPNEFTAAISTIDIENIGNIVPMPNNCVFSFGSFIPSSNAVGSTFDIVIAKDFIAEKYQEHLGVYLFAMYRKDGFTATGDNGTQKYLTSYIGLCGDGEYGSGAAIYRIGSDFVGVGGGETETVHSYGIPKTSQSQNTRSDCFIHTVCNYQPTMTIGTYNGIAFEAGCEYLWFAILNKDVYEV